MNDNFKSMPKVELHSHLDCTLSYKTVSRLVPGITEQKYLDLFVAPARCASLAEYLQYTRNGVDLLQSKSALQLAVSGLFDQLVEEHVIYTELRFAPFLHTFQGLRPAEVVEIVAKACDQAVQNTGIEARIILCTLRHFPAEKSMETVKFVHAFNGTRVMAFDIAGDEAGYPTDPHQAAFQFAIEHGIYRTAHAGEALGAESVWETLEKFQPARIGHGIHSIEDPRLIEVLKDKQIHLEVCPRCNVQTQAVHTIAEHPVDRLYQAGLSLSISTDTRGITQTTLYDEYTTLSEKFNWGAEQFLSCNLLAVEAAFCTSELKATLRKQLLSA